MSERISEAHQSEDNKDDFGPICSGDETWLHLHDPQKKEQSMECSTAVHSNLEVIATTE
ncbi:hypothetical protein SK128_009288, partial [Halocaridina rubra]